MTVVYYVGAIIGVLILILVIVEQPAGCLTKTFFDPVPAGKTVTNVTARYYSGGCAGSYMAGSINGYAVPTVNDANTGCLCSDNPCVVAAVSSNNYPCGMPGYVYG